MREIKFRAWFDGKMDYDPNVDGGPYGLEVNDIFDIKHKPYMQYTGLKDKDGKDIYEGDVISGFEENCHHLVSYHCEFAMFLIDVFPLREIKRFGKGCIIGNIYENPELMEKNNEQQT